MRTLAQAPSSLLAILRCSAPLCPCTAHFLRCRFPNPLSTICLCDHHGIPFELCGAFSRNHMRSPSSAVSEENRKPPPSELSSALCGLRFESFQATVVAASTSTRAKSRALQYDLSKREGTAHHHQQTLERGTINGKDDARMVLIAGDCAARGPRRDEDQSSSAAWDIVICQRCFCDQ